MSLIPYALTRRFLFGLDPETAHELTMDALARTYRYLDPTEVETQRKAREASQKAAAGANK